MTHSLASMPPPVDDHKPTRRRAGLGGSPARVAAAPLVLPAGFALIVLGRFMTNVATRAVYPFLPNIADGLGVSLTAIGLALAVRELFGMSAPLLGRRLDRAHLGRAMGWSLVGVAAAVSLVPASSGLVLFAVALTGVTVIKNIYDIASTAWVGHRVPFAARGRAIGLLEMAWAGSFLLGMPVLALLIRAGTWRTPFLVIAIIAAPIGLIMAARVGDAGDVEVDTGSTRPPVALLAAPVIAMTAMGVGHQSVLVSYSSWLEDQHGLSVGGLGLVAVVLGGAELLGTFVAFRASDRIGKRSSVLAGQLLLIPAALALPLGGATPVVAFVLLAAIFGLFEFAFVSFLPLFSELDPDARSAVIAWAFGAFSAGHALGAVVGSVAYETWSITATALLCAACFAVAAATVSRRVVEPA